MLQYRQPLPSISPLWPIGARSAFYVGQPVYDGVTNSVVKAAAPSFTQTPVDASTYGFTTADADGTTNTAALATMGTALAAAGGYTIVKFVGTYRFDASGITYLSAILTLTGLKNVIIDASAATFLLVGDNVPKGYLISFVNCTNVIIRANWQGTNHTNGTNGVGGIWLKSGNSSVDYAFTANKMYEGLRVGGGELVTDGSALYEGNHDINVWAKCVDVYFAVLMYYVKHASIYCEASGTVGANGSYRAIHLQSCDDVRGVSRTKNIGAANAVNSITTGERFTAPNYVPCTNIWLDCTDLGTSPSVANQCLVKVYNVAGSSDAVTETAVNVDNIHINIDVRMSSSIWGSVPVVSFGFNANHAVAGTTYTNIFISGRMTRLDATNYRIITLESDATVFGGITCYLVNLHDTAAGRDCFRSVCASSIPIAFHTYLCDVGTFTFPVAAAPQTVTAH